MVRFDGVSLNMSANLYIPFSVCHNLDNNCIKPSTLDTAPSETANYTHKHRIVYGLDINLMIDIQSYLDNLSNVMNKSCTI